MAEKNCIRCGKCCDEFPMSLEQIQRIENYLESNPDVMENLRNTPEIIAPLRRVCPFLRSEDGRTYCTIYPVRPEICKVFGVKDIPIDLKCPEGSCSTELSAESAMQLLRIYTEPKGDFFVNTKDYFHSLIKSE